MSQQQMKRQRMKRQREEMSKWSEWIEQDPPLSVWSDCLKFTSFDLKMGCRSSCTAGAEAKDHELFVWFWPVFFCDDARCAHLAVSCCCCVLFEDDDDDDCDFL